MRGLVLPVDRDQLRHAARLGRLVERRERPVEGVAPHAVEEQLPRGVGEARDGRGRLDRAEPGPGVVALEVERVVDVEDDDLHAAQAVRGALLAGAG